MKIIQKKLGLTQLLSFHHHKIPSIKGDEIIYGDSYKNIPFDIKVIDRLDEVLKIDDVYETLIKNKDNLNLYTNISGNLCLGYHRMVYIYNLINDIIEKSDIYITCLNRLQIYNVSDILYALCYDNVIVSNEKTMDYPIGTIVYVNERANDFNNLFLLEDKNCVCILWRMINKILIDGLGRNDYDKIITEPIANFNISIVNNIDDMGVMNNAYEIWSDTKHYYKGDRVLYSVNNDGNYELFELCEVYSKKVDKCPINSVVAHSLQFSDKDTYVTKSVDSDGNIEYYVRYQYYDGFYDINTRKVYFDDIDENGNLVLNHWKRCYVTEEILPDISVTATEESFLTNFRRMKKSYDDNAKLLPFVIDSYDTTIGEIIYTLGERDITSYGANIMTDIEIYSLDSTTPIQVYSYDRDSENPYLNGTKGLTPSYFITSGDTPELIENGVICFKYIVDALFDDNFNYIPETGIKHKEYYKYSIVREVEDVKKEMIGDYEWQEFENNNNSVDNGISLMAFTPNTYTPDTYTPDTIPNANMSMANEKIIVEYDNEKIEYECKPKFSYVDIDYTQTLTPSENSFSEDGSVISIIEYSNIQTDKYINTRIYRDENLLGITDYNRDIDMNIERGNVSILERHNILSEVNSLDDLKNYKNNLFKI